MILTNLERDFFLFCGEEGFYFAIRASRSRGGFSARGRAGCASRKGGSRAERENGGFLFGLLKEQDLRVRRMRLRRFV